ncbi:MAG: hypothetical protein Q6361_04065 [Candidatus Hermodarchaeota archaeon]|nr:hypothetical protein [Candidatus Hermodarchaeota archaeon]
MTASDKEAILMRVSEFLQKAVDDLADVVNTVAKQVTEFQNSLKKIRKDLKDAKVTPMSGAATPLLATESTAGVSSESLFDFLEGEAGALAAAEPSGVAESILLGDVSATPVAPPVAAPPSAPPSGPPSAPPTAPPSIPPAAIPAAAPAVAPAPAAAPAAPGIAGLRNEMMAEIKRIKEIFES